MAFVDRAATRTLLVRAALLGTARAFVVVFVLHRRHSDSAPAGPSHGGGHHAHGADLPVGVPTPGWIRPCTTCGTRCSRCRGSCLLRWSRPWWRTGCVAGWATVESACAPGLASHHRRARHPGRFTPRRPLRSAVGTSPSRYRQSIVGDGHAPSMFGPVGGRRTVLIVAHTAAARSVAAVPAASSDSRRSSS